jgi:hypothetical protein
MLVKHLDQKLKIKLKDHIEVLFQLTIQDDLFGLITEQPLQCYGDFCGLSFFQCWLQEYSFGITAW